MKDYAIFKEWKKPLLVGIIFILTEFCGSIYLNFVSLRNIAVISMIFSLLFYKKINKESLSAISILIYYYVFVAFLGLFNDLYSLGGITVVFARFLPTVVLLLFISSYVNDYKCLKRIINVFIVIIILDSIATYLQGINHPIGWKIASIFQSEEGLEETMDIMSRKNATTTIGLSVASGFSGTVVGNGYLLASLGLLFIFPYFNHPNIKNLIISLSCFICVVVALIFNQQRLAFYVYMGLSCLIFLILVYKRHNYILLLVILLCAIIVYYYYFQSLFVDTADTDWGRLMNFEDEERTLKQNVFWESFFYDNCLLGNRTKFVQQFGATPHSLIIESILLGGIGGCILMLLFCAQIVYKIIKKLSKNNVFAIFCGMPSVALILISIKHSSGFHTGSTICAYALLIFILSELKLSR